MKLVIIESPLAGDFEKNIRYARYCMLDSLQRGEAPYLSHLLYTQCLNDELPGQRSMGIGAGLAWSKVAELRAVYEDLGLTSGMQKALDKGGVLVERRKLPEDLWSRFCRGYEPNSTKSAT